MTGFLKRIFRLGENDMAIRAQEVMSGTTELTGAAQGVTDQVENLTDTEVPDVAESMKEIDGPSPQHH
jgi:hypothetical protein